uniref:Uncharacterized protein n=1 Tax=Arundo donax TaxID=35708 RepID=A0A0A9ALG4_ARUDO
MYVYSVSVSIFF